MIPLIRALDTNGDGTGTKNAIGDYSTPTDFYIQPPAGNDYQINELHVEIKDAKNFDIDGYGALSALSNGIQILVGRGNATLLDLTNSLVIQTMAGWARYADRTQLLAFGTGTTNDVFTADIKFGLPVYLKSGYKFIVRCRDNLTGLAAHYFVAHGVDINNDY